MRSFAEAAEARIMEAAIPFIQKLCLGKWYNLEYQDRVSEACRIFLEDLRTMPLSTGSFLEEYRADLDEKMRRINRSTPSIRYGCSLDSLFSRKTGEFFDGYRFISSPMTDLSVVVVKEFLRSLPVQEREIVEFILEGYSKSEILDKLGISAGQFERKRGKIRSLCKSWFGNEVEEQLEVSLYFCRKYK